MSALLPVRAFSRDPTKVTINTAELVLENTPAEMLESLEYATKGSAKGGKGLDRTNWAGWTCLHQVRNRATLVLILLGHHKYLLLCQPCGAGSMVRRAGSCGGASCCRSHGSDTEDEAGSRGWAGSRRKVLM